MPKLYFWKREEKNSSLEVDYVIEIGKNIVPIEVKSGSSRKMKSLHQFIAEKQSPLGIKISSSPFGLENNILSLPFYMIHELPRLVREYMSKHLHLIE